MMKKIMSFNLVVFLIGIYNGQLHQDQTQIKSPESHAFEKYGNVPVNLYTGTIDLKIPIFSVPVNSENNIDLFLSHDSSGFIPHKKADLPGQGWALIAGGRITRTIVDRPDELQSNQTANVLGVDYRNGFLTGIRNNPPTNSDNTYNLDSGLGHKLNGWWYLGSTNYPYEGEPDIFSFNIMNLHGKFMVGNDGNIVVECNDPNLKVDMSGFPSNPNNSFSSFCSPPPTTIILTDGKGNKYFFGGDFSKYEISYYGTHPWISDTQYSNIPTITSLSISKIVLADGKEINFNYVVGTLDDSFCLMNDSGMAEDVITSNPQLFNMESFAQSGAKNVEWIYAGIAGTFTALYESASETPTQTFALVKKSVLSSIEYGNTKIKINYKSIGYPIKHWPYVYNYLNETVIDYIEKQYNNIMVERKTFNYANYGGAYQRPFLNSLLQMPSNTTYSFEYYMGNYNLPPYTTFGIDHWGYWNGNDSNTGLAPLDTYNAQTGDYTLNNTFRDANPNLYNVGLLKKIIYPTKGYSMFEYEPQYYGKRIERNSSSSFLPTLTNNSGLAGGARIKRQYDVSENNIINNREYRYSTTLNGTTSSGILMHWPRYIYYFENVSGNITSKSLLRTSSNTIETSLDSYNVGYSKVYEVNTNKGYIEHNFTSYEDYPDAVPQNIANANIKYFWDTPEQVNPENLYKNFKSLYGVDKSILRGKPSSERYFSQNDLTNPIKIIEYEYTDNIDFNPNSQIDNNNYVAINHLSGLWAQGYKKYFNSSYLKKKSIKDYFNGNEVKTTTEYIYDAANHLNISKETKRSPENNEVKNNYSYAYEKGNQLLINKNIIGIPLETVTTQTIGITTKTLSRLETVYPTSLPAGQSGNLALPISVRSSDLQNMNNSYTEITYDKYDSKGNLQQYTAKDGVSTTIIWGYNQTQPIAKITGAQLSNISQSLIDSIVNASEIDNAAAPGNDESAFLSVLDTFRKDASLVNYQITTYTYDPLIGIRSITPPSGIREVYIYDTGNRLMEIRENNQAGKLLKEFKYNYKN